MDERVRHALQRMSGISPARVDRWPALELAVSEWVTCADPTRMLDFLVAGPASNRKLRLFACACCRRIWHLLPEAVCRDAVALAERYADGLATDEELADGGEAFAELWDRYYTEEPDGAPRTTAFLACIAASATTISDSPRQVPGQVDRYIPVRTWAPASAAAGSHAGGRLADRCAEEAAQCDLLREIFGNPFQPIAVDPKWQSDAVRAVARAAYEVQAFDCLPILADALQDAGCEEEQVLGHCHSPGLHVRGCWLLDLLLGLK